MINHPYKCICVAQRKVASTSIARAFDVHWSIDNKEWHYANGGIQSPEWHSRPKDFFTFSFVRNPWDRLVSGWLYCPQTKNVPLRDLLRHLPLLSSDPHGHAHITRLQRDTIVHQGQIIVDFLGRFENLQTDFDHVCSAIGKKPTVLEVANKCPTRRKTYQEYFSAPTDRELFLRHFRPDVETFQYVF